MGACTARARAPQRRLTHRVLLRLDVDVPRHGLDELPEDVEDEHDDREVEDELDVAVRVRTTRRTRVGETRQMGVWGKALHKAR